MKNKKRVVLVIAFLILFAIYVAVNVRGEYLQTLEIGEQYVEVFKQNLKYKVSVIVVNFAVLYIATYITTRCIKRGLKKFFEEDKKEMPKLPNKSISLILSIVVSMITSNMLIEKTMLALNGAYFGVNDPVFNVDIGYYIFQKPFIEALIIYFIGLMILYTVYIAAYYIISFNKYFERGINPETLKKNTFVKQIITNIVLIILAVSAITIVKVQDVVCGKFLNLSNGISLYGAGLIDVTIKVWGYRIFAVIISVCAIMAIRNFKKENFKKVIGWLSTIPIYLIALFLVILVFDLVYINKNELDKEKSYIQDNIALTKKAYDINIDEIEMPVVTPSVTITILGGIMGPSPPEIVIKPAANSSSYPSFFISGYMTDPIAATVPGAEPDRAAKKAQATTVAIANPPRILLSKASANRTNRFEMPPSSISFPARMKNGIAIKENESIAVNIF